MKVLTDKNLINEFLTRGIANIYPNYDSLYKKLMSGERLRVYQGFDPTGPYLHVGHAIGMRAMRILQKLGHEVIFLIGDFTSRVGDPDKDTARKILSLEEIHKNMQGWKEQASQIINFEGENAVKFMHNYDWLSKLTLNDIIELMTHLTVQRMLERDMFEKRYRQGIPIYLQEFIYPLMQGYDSVAMNIDIEICGDDQTFNALVGRQLVKSYLNKEKFIRTHKLMDAPDGITMSKTKGNGINLSDSPNEMYGKAMSYDDDHIIIGFELLTSVDMKTIDEIKKEIENGANPMQFKKMMAYEIVKEIKGEKAAKEAQQYFEKTVQNKELPDDIKIFNIKKEENLNIVELLVKTKLASSKNEAKRLISEKGIKINNEVVNDEKFIPTKNEFILQRGKRQFIKVIKE